MPTTQIKKHQTFSDFVVQATGDDEQLFITAMLNGVGITDDIIPGTTLKFEVSNKKVAKDLSDKALDIITQQNLTQPGGIDYMQIGTSFKIR